MFKHNVNSHKSIKHDLPYRPCVGMMILNKNHQVFVAQRTDSKTQAWQMPQGGINIGETPSKAVYREMLEEIGTNNAKIILESKAWYSYDIPDFLISKLWQGSYRGQKQKWFLIQFLGEDKEININTLSPEFSAWQWVEIDELVNIIVPFKKKLYATIVAEFKPFISNELE